MLSPCTTRTSRATLTNLGIMEDFVGPDMRLGPDHPSLLTMEEYRAMMRLSLG